MKRGLDLNSVIGIVVALGCILVGQALGGGHVGSILQLTAALIVFGGTLGAVMVAFPLEDFMGGVKAFRNIFTEAKLDQGVLIQEIVGYGQTARNKGLLALEGEIDKASTALLARGLRLAVDGTDPQVLRDVLETEIGAEEERAKRHARVYESAGGFAPTVGILGAVLGLIHVMENLTDPSKLGGGIAVAFVATVYGVAAANLFFLPAAHKLKVRQEIESQAQTIMLEGVLAVQLSENPRVIEERLKSYLPESARRSPEPAQVDKAAQVWEQGSGSPEEA